MDNSVRFNRGFDPDFYHLLAALPYTIDNSKSEDSRISFLVDEGCPKKLDRNLARLSHRMPDQVWIGAGCDPYPAVERKTRVTRRILEVLAKHGCSLMMISRSPMLLRDIDLIREIHEISLATVAIACPSFNPDKVRLLEPRAPALRNRIQALLRLVRSGIQTGICMTPLHCGVNDTEDDLEKAFKWARRNNLDFIMFPDLTKLWKSKSILSSTQSIHRIRTSSADERNHSENDTRHLKKLRKTIFRLSGKYNIPLRMKRYYPSDSRQENYWLAERLAETALNCLLAGKSFSPYLAAARKVNALKEDIRSHVRSGQVYNQPWITQPILPEVTRLLEGGWVEPGLSHAPGYERT